MLSRCFLTHFVKRFLYARTCTRQNSTVENGGNRSNGGEGICVYPHRKKEGGILSKNVEKIPLGRGQVCVE